MNALDFDYELPEEKIARYPLAQRDLSKLLYYNNGHIQHEAFLNLPNLLPQDSTLVFNNSKVFPARLFFQKDTGANIEIFCLQPLSNLSVKNGQFTMLWQCMVGNQKRWKEGQTLKHAHINLSADLIGKQQDTAWVQFSWNETEDFYAVLEKVAELPLPPYLQRKAEESDKERYQTVFAREKGSVAAPTAGLHFTENVFKKLEEKNIPKHFVTLHVGAGTFKPLQEGDVRDHEIHSEQFSISKTTLIELSNKATLVPIGTTSVRLLESIYWIGAKMEQKKNADLDLKQYENEFIPPVDRKTSLENLIQYLDDTGLVHLIGRSSIYILPGYKFHMTDALVTNFHQPQSTLLLLVGALVGVDNMKQIYQEALDQNYRFLSYGDSCLLCP